LLSVPSQVVKKNKKVLHKLVSKQNQTIEVALFFNLLVVSSPLQAKHAFVFFPQTSGHRKQLKLVPKFIVFFLSQKIYSPNQSFTISNTKKNATFERYVLGHKKPHGFVFNHKTQKLFFGPKKKSISFFLAERAQKKVSSNWRENLP